jgi:integrase
MPIKIYKRGKVWHYRGTVAGRRLRGSTQTTDKTTAAQITARIEARQWQSNLHGPEAVLSFAQAAINYRAAGKSPRFLEKIEDYWRDTLVKDINAGAIRASAATLYPGTSGATKNRQVIIPTQAIINHAAESELCQKISVRRFEVETKIKKPITLTWVDKFAAAAPPHLGALARFMFLTGCRIGEALSLRWEDLDFDKRTALIRATKIGAERLAHLPAPLVVALANVARLPGRTVFRYTAHCSADKSWRAVCKRAKIPVLSFHSCRHGFATSLLQANVDPVTVAKLGGWKSAEHVFKTYGHASDDMTLTDRIAGTKLTQTESAYEIQQAKSKGYLK